ncbi:MAG: glutamine synthetase [Myxococcota bacterium]|nr:glutamine synthetase [Myxococcota bacterium]
MSILAEYIWIDGHEPTASLRAKTKVLTDPSIPPSTSFANVSEIPMSFFPEWGADGSSTNQADGANSDIVLRPVSAIRDPYRPGHYLVMCEVFNGDGSVHRTNHRAQLRRVLDAGAASAEALFGFEQEYTYMTKSGTPYGFPDGGEPAPQGPYYCAVGAGNIHGRDAYEEFLQMCLDAGVSITGTNWEVMPGQAEVQVFGDSLTSTDHIWFARWLLHRSAEPHGICVTLDAKPAKGDWNGAGMHTNFSTNAMRREGGIQAITDACEKIGRRIDEHLAVYGSGFEERLTGDHETCSYKEFKYGAADRTASIRIPRNVAAEGKGYLEDRRPNANADPYLVAATMLKTVCVID